MRTCRVSHCGQPPKGPFSRYCSSHRARLRRHGHPEQTAIPVTRLKPYIKLFRDFMARQPNQEEIRAAMEGSLRALGASAAAHVAEYNAGRAKHWPTVAASKEVLKVLADIPLPQIIETVSAMVMLQEREPGSFYSDEAYWCQLARRFRLLTDANTGFYFTGPERMTQRRSYRDMNPKGAIALGQLLANELGPIGLQVCRTDWHEKERPKRAKAALWRALSPTSPPSPAS